MRSFIEHKLHALDPVNKLYYLGPMFRYERPQKGRYRQFHQIGAEVIGVDDPRIDAQVLIMLVHFFAAAGIDAVELQINSLGCPECRPDYRQLLVTYLQSRLDVLCEDCRRRYLANPLRVLDCKVPGCREATAAAPSVLEHLCNGCNDHFASVRRYLDETSTTYAVNPRMVRGLDYYTKTTFEMVTNNLGAQNAVAAGGRYDGLIKSLGGPPLSGIGFAAGLERLALLKTASPVAPTRPDLFIAALGETAAHQAFLLMSKLLQSELRVEIDFLGKSLKSQLRRADKLGARFVLILGEDELARNSAPLRDMQTATQEEITLTDLPHLLTERLQAV
jgi:histidyl-tRNA synthetase